VCLDCETTRPTYGTESGKALYCAGCAAKRPTEGLRNTIGKKCLDCQKKTPNYGTEPGKALYCADCAAKRPTEGLRNTMSKMCMDCKEKQPTYGTEPGKALYCSGCASKRPTEGLRNTIGKKCLDCKEKQPTYGTEPGKRLYCAGCAAKRPTEGLRNTVTKMCLDCKEKQPSYGPKSGKALYCAICANKRPTEELHNLVNTPCKTPHCTTFISNKNYKGHCLRCFINTYPDNQIVRNFKTKERAVADFVRSVYPDFTIAFDQRVADGCSRRRPDILMDLGEYVIITEIDENQHEAYDCMCENKRLMQLFTDIGSRPLVMVRFNPDQYYDQRKKSVPSCWGYTKDKGLCVVKPNKKDEWAARLATLKTTLDLVISQGTEKEVDEILLYYDGF